MERGLKITLALSLTIVICLSITGAWIYVIDTTAQAEFETRCKTLVENGFSLDTQHRLPEIETTYYDGYYSTTLGNFQALKTFDEFLTVAKESGQHIINVTIKDGVYVFYLPPMTIKDSNNWTVNYLLIGYMNNHASD